MRQVRQLWFPFVLVVVVGVIFSTLLPYFPVDETRYLSVAWEMKLHNSFIVPLQNALPYSHKPPLLFWLLNLNWLLLGVNELTLRFVPVLFSLLNIAMVYKIGLLLWGEEKIARYAAIILSSTLSYLLWSSLIMFDIVLTFWVLLGIFGLLSASKEQGIKPWLLVGLSIGAGVLTKGPVVCVYILPLGILSSLWLPEEAFSRRWFGCLALSVLTGIAVILAWLIPAAMTGGETYREAILWGQTVNRMANAFAHKRPVWWYLPMLPALLLPWILLPQSWRGSSRWTADRGSRFAIIWVLAALVILSLISSKQFHYLIPLLPAFSLLMARNIVTCNSGEQTGSWRYAIGAFYSLIGVAALSLSFMKLGRGLEHISVSGLRVLALGLMATGSAMFLLKRSNVSTLVRGTALSSVVAWAAIAVTGASFFDRYDLRQISQAVKAKQEQGYTVLHFGKYHGQYQFLGRLSRPLVAVDSVEALNQYAARENSALITYEPPNEHINKEDIYFKQPFRSKQVVLWNKRGISNFLKQEGKLGVKPLTQRRKDAKAQRETRPV